jgi:hypothetical protein
MEVIVQMLAKLGIRRQARLDVSDYLVLAEDLMRFEMEDIRMGLDDLGNQSRRDGQTAFPDWPTLKQAVAERKLLRAAEDLRNHERLMEQARRENPELFMSFHELMRDYVKEKGIKPALKGMPEGDAA